MVSERAVKTVFRIPDSVSHIGNRGTVSGAARFEIDTADLHIAGTFPHAEKIGFRRCQDLLIMLRHDMADAAQM